MSGTPSDSVLLPVQHGFAPPASGEMPTAQVDPMPTAGFANDGSSVDGIQDGLAPAQDAPPIDLSQLEDHESAFLLEHFGSQAQQAAEAKFKEDKANLQRTFAQQEQSLRQQAQQATARAQQAETFARASAAKMQAWAKEHGLDGEFATWFLGVQGQAAQQTQAAVQTQTEAQQFITQQRQAHLNELSKLSMDGDRLAFPELGQDTDIQRQYLTFENLAHQDMTSQTPNPQLTQAAQRAYEDLRTLMWSKREALLRQGTGLDAARQQAANRQLADARGPQQRVNTSSPMGGAPNVANMSEEQLTQRARDQVKQQLGRDPNNGDYRLVFDAKQRLKMDALLAQRR